MNIRPEDRVNILASGTFVVFSLVIIALSIFMLSSENNIFSRRLNLVVEVENAQNLKRGAEVQLRGIKIGSVSAIEVNNLETLTITMRVNYSFREWIRRDSLVAFRTHGVLGDRFIEIYGGTEEAHRVRDGEVLTVKDDNVLDKFINKGEDILVVATRVLTRVDTILENLEPGTLNSILKNLDGTAKSTKDLLAMIEEKNLGRLIDNLSASSSKLNSTLTSVDQVSKQIAEGPGSLHSLIYDRSVHDDLKAILGGTKRNRVLQYFIRESIRKAD